MAPRVYRALLYLLPRDRRERHGADMALVFADQREDVRGRAGAMGVAWLWMRESSALLRFSLSECATRIVRWSERQGLAQWNPLPPSLFREAHSAWRGLRARGVRALLIVALLGVALAASTIVFASADSFVFNRTPYRDAGRLVEIGEQQRAWYSAVWPELVPVWRRQTDLFSAFHAHQFGAQVYFTSGEQPHFVWSEEVTPGTFEMLGVAPRWGRSFVDHDALPGAAPTVILAEEIARQEFGNPARAVGQILRADPKSPLVVGVMPLAFRFPSGSERIWRPLDLTSVRKNSLISPIARMAPGISWQALNRAVAERAPVILTSANPPWNGRKETFATEARPLAPSLVDPQVRRLFLLLCGAAACLLIVAGANVANLELATAIARSRVYAIASALGASRGTLVRSALIEGAMLMAASAAAAAGLAYAGTKYISTHLPPGIVAAITNPIDLDGRAIMAMIAVALLMWIVTALPAAIRSFRPNVSGALKLDGRTSSASRGAARLRQWLTIGEIAMTVLLLVGSLLTVRSYNALLRIPKGFDTVNVAAIDVRQRPNPPEKDADLQARLLAAIKARPDVVSASIVSAIPPTGAGSITARLQIGDAPRMQELTSIGAYMGDAALFETMHVPILSGRGFTSDEPAGSVIVDEHFAKKFFPNGNAVGATIDTQGASFGGAARLVIVGVAAHLRTSHDTPAAPSESFFAMYMPIASRYSSSSFLVRLRDIGRLGDFTSMLRTMTPTSRVSVTAIDDLYARLFGNELLAAAIMTAFGGLAFLVAAAGIYGVMTYLVASRTREIGIRMSLGADKGSINRLIFGSSIRLVAIGAAIGLGAAITLSRYTHSLLFGVSPIDPPTYAAVAIVVGLTALLATWPSARRAARVDTNILLRD